MTKPKRISDEVLHELSRISAAATVAKTFLDETMTDYRRSKLERLIGDIEKAEQIATSAMRKIRDAGASI